MEELQAKCSDLQDAQKKAVDEKAGILVDYSTLKDVLATKKSEADRELRNKEKLDKELKDARNLVDDRNALIVQKDETLHKAKEEISKLELHVKEQRHATEKVMKECEILGMKLAKAQSDNEQQIRNMTDLLNENQQCLTDIKAKDDLINRLREEIKVLNRTRVTLAKKLKNSEHDRQDVEQEKDGIKV